MHALWIEWRTDLVQTQALLALAGVDDVAADPHEAFDEACKSGSPHRQDPEERRRMIAELVAAAGG
ncbi:MULTISPECIES: hypothetical protein [Nonomuraea]|uniref:Uncharacterized protein n=1 Tax=Nonomuraea helvata TaxID=37484 RepID=A0ABV5SLS5_9ACTN|nr:hypothetical protein [Nonomuraea angiospora]MDX3100442.1 hypothetical protein [Nonomuraea angiospora]